jgi:hypothetical protein
LGRLEGLAAVTTGVLDAAMYLTPTCAEWR